MKLAVFSDSHGRVEPMLSAIEEASPDMILFLGDGASDVEKIKKQFPQIPLRAVRGNCDFNSVLPETDSFTADGVRIFMTHGHLFGVKSGMLYALAEAADNSGAALALYGHTHLARMERVGEITVLNPGSCGDRAPSFAEIEICSGEFSSRIKNI